jgi:hypothetical protein
MNMKQVMLNVQINRKYYTHILKLKVIPRIIANNGGRSNM